MSSPRDGLCVSTAMALALAAFSTTALAGTFTVTTTSDDVTGGTLRQAILAANSNPGSDRIEFAIGTGAQTIIIRSNLPPITDTAVIDGTTQPGFAGVPLISIKGRNSTGTMEDSGLTIASSGCLVRGLNFQRFQLRSPGAGVVISGGSGSTIAGCTIGTDPDGMNFSTDPCQIGVLVLNSSANRIGGTNPPDRNIIGNAGYGVLIMGAGATQNVLAGNYIGLNAAGTGVSGLGNSQSGVVISNAPNNTIGGTASGSANILAQNQNAQVRIRGQGSIGNTIAGNLIGTKADGTALSTSPGLSDGIGIEDAPGTTIGGTSPGSANLISGNQNGISIAGSGSSNNIIQGNFIGTGLGGSGAIPNANGITDNGGGSLIGGTVPNARNIICGQANQHLSISSNSVVQGNLIGVDVSGLHPNGNAFIALQVNGSNNQIGGPSVAARNIIGGASRGIQINALADNNTVQGNFIGLGSDGSTGVGISSSGLLIYGSTSNVIGGDHPGEGNIISGCNGDAVTIGSAGATPASDNRIMGNSIGADTSGFAAIADWFPPSGTSLGPLPTLSGPGNGGNGILVLFANNTLIQHNVIFNPGQKTASDGVQVDAGNANQTRACIFAGIKDPGIPVDMGGQGFVQNDPGDLNPPQNFPVLTSAQQGSVIAIGSLNSVPNTSFDVEFSMAGPEELAPIGSVIVTTDASGHADISARLPFPVALFFPTGTKLEVRAAATRHDGETSEFSPPVPLLPGGLAQTNPTTTANYPFAGTVGHPVSTFTGELFDSLPPDLFLDGPLPLVFQRYYASFLKRDGKISGTLGDNWLHNFEMKLTATTTNVEVITAGGRIITFTNLNGSFALVSPLDTPYGLTALSRGGGYVLANPRSERLFHFDNSGKLTSVSDRNGNTLTLSYNSNQLVSVSDGLGRSFTFAYNTDGQLTNVSDGARSVSFVQTGSNLTGVSSPLGFITTYSYDSGRISGLLSTATLPEGNAPFTQSFDAQGRVATQTFAGSNVWNLGFSGASTVVTNPLGAIVQDQHTPSGQLASFTDEAGQTLSIGSNTNGQRAQITDRSGNTTSIAYDAASGKPSAFTNADGTTTLLSYAQQSSSAGFYHVSQVRYADGTSESLTHDANGNLIQRVDQGGFAFSFSYNSRGQLLSATNPLGGVLTRSYSADGMPVKVQDSDTGSTQYQFDALKRLTDVIHPDGTAVHAVYDAGDRLISITDERGNTTRFDYDQNSRVTQITDATGHATQFSYDSANRLVQALDRLGNAAQLTYDPLNHLAATTDRNGLATRFTYDSRQRLTAITDSGGQKWQFDWDKEGLLSAASNPLTQTNRFLRDSLGYLTESVNPLNQSASVVRDSLRRVTQSIDALLRTNRYAYDARGLLTNAAVPLIGGAAYERNALGLLTKITGLNGESWSLNYTPMGRLLSTTDPLNRTTSRSYDSRGRVNLTAFADGTSVSSSYDGSGNMLARQFSTGLSLAYQYDALNRLTSADDLALSYDAEGRVTKTVSSGIAFGAAYDAGGRLTSVSYNNGALIVSYQYDNRNRLTQVSDSLTSAKFQFSYDDAGRLLTATRANGVNGAYTYDAAGRLTRIQEGSIIDLQYQLNAVGEPISVNFTAPLDPANLLSPQNQVFNYDLAHQISNAGYAYDARGRLISTPGASLTWDGASRLMRVGNVTLSYNGLGDLVSRADPAVSSRFYYNYAIKLTPIILDKSDRPQALRYYVWSPGGRLLYCIDAVNGNAVQYFHFDRSGSTLALTASGGTLSDAYAYTPYGVLLAHTGASPQPFTYVGEFGVRSEPAAGLYHMRARYYDPVSARFVSPDPIGSSLFDPQTLDPYAYAAQSPLRFIDPSGTKPAPDYGGLDYLGSLIEVLTRKPEDAPKLNGLYESPRPSPPTENSLDAFSDAGDATDIVFLHQLFNGSDFNHDQTYKYQHKMPSALVSAVPLLDQPIVITGFGTDPINPFLPLSPKVQQMAAPVISRIQAGGAPAGFKPIGPPSSMVLREDESAPPLKLGEYQKIVAAQVITQYDLLLQQQESLRSLRSLFKPDDSAFDAFPDVTGGTGTYEGAPVDEVY